MHLDRIRSAITPLRESLLGHPVYRNIANPAALRTFMEHHVFAVWDFMSLLKSLQQAMCPTAVPWSPPADPVAARLINEIVLGEESDEDGQGGFASHFVLYHRAMSRFGAKTTAIDCLLKRMQQGVSLETALRTPELNDGVRRFVTHTFGIIASGDLCQIASAFTFGREDLLPDVFQKIVDQIDVATQGGLADFKYYLQRHIDLDGDEHGPMATRLVSSLCGTDPIKWQAATNAAISSLQARLAFWDTIYDAVLRNR